MNVDDIFGVSRELPLNYVQRDGVDNEFVNRLARDLHIVIYGSSKQGKTSLRKKWLDENDYIIISSSNKWKLADLHSSILKEAGFEVELATSRSVSGQTKVAVKARTGIMIPLFGSGEAEAGVDDTTSNQKEVQTRPLEIDPADANDIIRSLESIKFSKFIVIEDFHYLPEETQRDFAFCLKTFHENSKFCFIIIGVWREENRLIGFNGDLTERVYSLNADAWKASELQQVIQEGERLLNAEFSEDFKDHLIENCFESVHIVQESCRRAARHHGVFSASAERKTIPNDPPASHFIKRVVDDQKGRYMGFLQNVAEGFQSTEKEMPKWVIYAILKSTIEELSKGIRLRDVSQIIKSRHPDGEKLNPGNITQILKTFSSLQSSKNIRPIVFDYDNQNRILSAVDRGFLIWLANQNREEILDELGLPTD